MTYQTELQNSETSEEEQKLQNSESCKEEQDLAKMLFIDFKKIESLNIRIPCSICEEMVYISQLFHHKKVHQAQAVLDYQWPYVEPIDIKKIILQRKQLILRLQKTAQYPEREVEKIGCSIDLLKESIKIAPYFCIDNVVQSSVYIKDVSNPLIKAIAICQDKNAVWHTEMEDVFIVLDNYGHKRDTCLLGLFDGSNGISAAQLTSDELPLLLLDQLSHNDSSYQISDAEKNMLHSFCTIFKEDYELKEQVFSVAEARSQNSQPNKYEWIHRAFAKAFWRMDRLLRLGRDEVSKVRWSSCTTAICLVEMAGNTKQNQEEQEGEETVEKINDNKEQNFLQHEKGLPEPNRRMIRRIIEQEVHKIMEQQEEKPLGRVSGGEDQNNTEQGAGSLTEHPRELFTSINDGMKKSIIVSEDNEQLAENKDEIQEEVWIENNENSDEIAGIMHIANIGNEEETEPSFQLKLPINNSTEEKVVQSNSCTISTKQLSENYLETSANVPTSSKENTSPDTKVIQKENKKNSEDLISESHEFLQISEDSETDSRTFYNLAAKYITKHLVKAALKAGSRNNVSVLLALLNGCDNIPTDVLMGKIE
ncbi:Protein phosphatase 2C-like domain-containing protein 1, partial [Ophiophagus hannah]